MSSAQRCVEAGVVFLDERRPDWFLRVDPVTVNIESPKDCVLGQVYGSWLIAMLRLGLSPAETYRMGFNQLRWRHLRLRRLNAAWRREIEARQAEHRAILRARRFNTVKVRSLTNA